MTPAKLRLFHCEIWDDENYVLLDTVGIFLDEQVAKDEVNDVIDGSDMNESFWYCKVTELKQPEDGEGFCEPGKVIRWERGDEVADDLCDLYYSSGVNVERTTWCGKTIGIECGCEAGNVDGTCCN